MRSTMASDYVLPKQGFFSKPTFSHALMNPNITTNKPEPKKYNPDQYPAESVTWKEPQANPFETSYMASFKEPSSKKVINRVKQEKPIIDRNLSDSLVPMRLPLETKRYIPGHHISGIFGRNFTENPRPQLKQYPGIKNLDNMAQTTLALGPSIEREKLGMGALKDMHHHNQKNASHVLRTIYINRSEVQENLRFDHNDIHNQAYEIANMERFNNEIYQYNRQFGGRAGASALTRRLYTPEPIRKERTDVKAHAMKKLLSNSFIGERDYNAVEKDFKNAYKTQAIRRFHDDHYAAKTARGREGKDSGKSFSGGLTYEEYNRSRTPELGKGSKTSRSETPNRKSVQNSPPKSATPKKKSPRKRETERVEKVAKVTPPSMSARGFLKKYK